MGVSMKRSSTGCSASGKGHRSPHQPHSNLPSLSKPFLSSLISKTKREGWSRKPRPQLGLRLPTPGGKKERINSRTEAPQQHLFLLEKEKIYVHIYYFDFIFAYSRRLPSRINHLAADILAIFLQQSHTNTHTHMSTDARAVRVEQVVCLCPFISFFFFFFLDFFFFFTAVLEIAMRSRKCQVLDLFARLYSGAQGRGGTYKCRDEGLQPRRGCASQISFFDGAPYCGCPLRPLPPCRVAPNKILAPDSFGSGWIRLQSRNAALMIMITDVMGVSQPLCVSGISAMLCQPEKSHLPLPYCHPILRQTSPPCFP